MKRHTVMLALALVITLLGAGAAADTTAFRDPRDPVGRHDIVKVTVDNTGTRVGATVVHRRAQWKGKVRLAFDTSGGPRPEYLALVPHGHPGEATLRRNDGKPWRCASRTVRSRWVERTMSLSGARSCFAGAERLRIRVTATSPGHHKDVAVTKKVPKQSRPNVIMIMVDDMRADDLAYMPLTRSLIGAEGVTFANSLAPYPLCCPARASVLLGQYAHNHRVWSHVAPWGFPALDDHSTIATWLHDAGYATVYLGKYLNGYGSRPEPGATEGNSVTYVPPGWTDWRASIDGGLAPGNPKNGGTYRYFDTTLNNNGKRFDNYAGRYQTNVYGRLAEQVVTSRAASDTPFFFYLSFTAPHHGLPKEQDDPPAVVSDDGTLSRIVTPAVPGGVRGRFDKVITEAPGASWYDLDPSDKPEYLRRLTTPNSAELDALLEAARQRAEAVSVVDRQVQRTIEALRAAGELDDTLVMFTSDNGYFLGEQKIRQGKILPYEPSIRTPLLMRGPGIPAGQVRYDPFLSIDFAPTIARFTGVEPGLPVDGTSLLFVARNGDRGWSRPVLTETGPQGTVRDTDESGQPLDTPDAGEPDIRYVIGVRTDRYLYTHVASEEEELYDMAVDPRQYDNVIKEPAYADIADLMRQQLQRVRACDVAECRVALPPELATQPGESIVNPA